MTLLPGDATRLQTASALVLAAMAFAMGAPDAHAGAWAQPDRGVYFKLAAGASTGSTQYKDTGEVFDMVSEDMEGSFQSVAGIMYAEFGVLPNFTIYGSAVFNSLVLDTEIAKSTTTGFGDVWLGARYQILSEPLVVSVSLAVKTPTGYSPAPGALVPTLGNGVREYDARLLIGHSFYPIPVYVSAEAGYRLRGSRLTTAGSELTFGDEIPYFLELGYAPIDVMWLRGVVSGVYGLGNPQELDVFSLSPLAQSYTKVGPSVIVTLYDHYQLSFDYLFTVLGTNTVRSHDVVAGLAFNFGL